MDSLSGTSVAATFKNYLMMLSIFIGPWKQRNKKIHFIKPIQHQTAFMPYGPYTVHTYSICTRYFFNEQKLGNFFEDNIFLIRSSQKRSGYGILLCTVQLKVDATHNKAKESSYCSLAIVSAVLHHVDKQYVF